MSKNYSLSLRGEAFNSLCADFDTTLRDVLAGMIHRLAYRIVKIGI